MKSLVIAAAVALGLVSSAAQAAEYSKTTYTTPKSAALHGAAYKLDKKYEFKMYEAKDLKVAKTIDKTPPTMKYRVVSKDVKWNGKPWDTRTMTVHRTQPHTWKFKR